MRLLDHNRDMARNNAWSNNRLLTACATLTDEEFGATRVSFFPSLRQTLNHISDTERMFAYRALWFGRGFSDPLASYDQNISASGAWADECSWARQVAEFGDVRRASLALYRNFPAEAWKRSGVASGNPVTVHALAYIIAGHFAHHMAILRERYL